MKKIFTLLLAALCTYTLLAQQLAFPDAVGFGRFASGGRGGSVYHVTNLDDDGTGSLRDAVSQQNRTVVFDVAGVINLKSGLSAAKNITIAGQTAPGDGVTVYGNKVHFSDNSIVRYMRFRGGINMPRGACVVIIDSVQNVILDHISVEWGRWDNLHLKGCNNVTLQNCLVGEPIDPQRFGALFEGPTNVSINHCLWIDCQSRNPKAKGRIEYINNVVYNWGVCGFVGGHSAADHYQDVVANYFIAGPNSGKNFVGEFAPTDHVYQRDNFTDMNKDGVLNGRPVLDTDFVSRKATVVSAPQNQSDKNYQLQTAQQAYETVVWGVGASLHRDAVDERIIGYLTSLGKSGQIFHTEAEAGGQPTIAPAKAAKDSDGDGIPDGYENSHQLNAKTAADGAQKTASGYSNLEVYINSLAK